MRRAFVVGVEELWTRLVSKEAISAIRLKADLARRLSAETRDPAAKAALAEMASLLDVDAEKLDSSRRGFSPSSCD